MIRSAPWRTLQRAAANFSSPKTTHQDANSCILETEPEASATLKEIQIDMQDVSPFRVLFFESWTKGIVNCHRIMNAAPAGVFEFKLLHISSVNYYNGLSPKHFLKNQ